MRYYRATRKNGTLHIYLGLMQEDILPALWCKWLKKLTGEEKERRKKYKEDHFPEHIAILSFAGLDTHDTLLYPLLGHELGHFIDYSFQSLEVGIKPPLHQLKSIKDGLVKMFNKEVPRILGGELSKDIGKVKEKIDTLIQLSVDCLRELLADILAVRMLGFSFFVAHAQELKSLYQWGGPPIDLSSGYPSMELRLSVVLDHLTTDDYPGNFEKFLKESTSDASSLEKSGKDNAELLKCYVENWKECLIERCINRISL